MSSLTLDDTVDIRISADSLSGEPAGERRTDTGINGNNVQHTRYRQDSFSFETTPLTSSKVDEIENHLKDNSNRVTCSGIIDGECDVTIENSSYVFSFQNGEPQIDSQRLSINVKKLEGGGD